MKKVPGRKGICSYWDNMWCPLSSLEKVLPVKREKTRIDFTFPETSELENHIIQQKSLGLNT